MSETHQSFTFVDAGRTFECRVDSLRPGSADAWWWFSVSTEPHQRHAPFRAADADTREAVRARVVAYYDALLARRAEPSRGRWGQRPGVRSADGAAAAPAAAAATVDAEEAGAIDARAAGVPDTGEAGDPRG